MKRSLDHENNVSKTPSKYSTAFPKPPKKSGSKRARAGGQQSIRSFFSTHEETPTQSVSALPVKRVDSWPSSAQRQFASMVISTPEQVDGQLADSAKVVSTSNRLPEADSSIEGQKEESPFVIFSQSDCGQKGLSLNFNEDLQDEDPSDFFLCSQFDYVRGSQAAAGALGGTPNLRNNSDDTQIESNSFVGLSSLGFLPSALDDSLLPAPELATNFCRRPSQVLTREMSLASAFFNAHAEDDCIEDRDQQLEEPVTQPEAGLDMELSVPTAQAGQTSEMHATTPELECCFSGRVGTDQKLQQLEHDIPPSVRRNGPAKMYNIFMPKSQQRNLLLIRHGESEFNRAMCEGNDFKDPMIFDPSLTARGVAQARALRSKLQDQLALHGGQVLWVVSPLRRAIETFFEACPLLQQAGACPILQLPGSSPQPLEPSKLELRVELSPTISEFVVTAGDVGTSASVLSKEFPLLSKHLAQLPEQWWYQAPSKQNCALQKQFNSSEPKEHRQKRVSELARWLSNRSEKLIIMIGHCSFWHEFRGKSDKRMANGEMHCMRW